MDLTAEVTGTLPVANGGTGATTLTDGGVLLGSGTSAVTATAVLTNGQLLIGDGTGDPTVGTLTGTSPIGITNGAGSITIAASDASTSAKGVASFSSDNFSVSSGAVTIKTGGVDNDELAGSIANSKLANSTVSYGGISLALGASDSTPAFDLTDATNYPTSSLSGTITNAQLAGSIANAKLANSSITVSDGSSSTATALGGTITFSGTSNEVEVAESSGTITIGLPASITANVTGNVTGNVSGTAAGLSATLAVASGGTGATSFADKAVIITQDTGTDTLAAAAMDANGELLIGGTSGPAVATLTAGSGISVTNADGAITIAAAGAGKILQAVTTGALTGNSTTGYQLEQTAASYSDVPGFTVDITPAATSSKVLVIASIMTWGTDSTGRIKIVHDASGSFADALISPSLSGSSVGGMQHSLAVIISPSTTSEFTVKLQGYSNQDGGSNRFRINWYETQSTLTVFEIGA